MPWTYPRLGINQLKNKRKLSVATPVWRASAPLVNVIKT
jgi:hypothetical protein